MEKFCLEESTVEVSKYFSGSKIKDRSSHGWLLFFFSSFISAVSLFELSQNFSSTSRSSYQKYLGSEDEWMTKRDREVITYLQCSSFNLLTAKF